MGGGGDWGDGGCGCLGEALGLGAGLAPLLAVLPCPTMRSPRKDSAIMSGTRSWVLAGSARPVRDPSLDAATISRKKEDRDRWQ